jgi:hypothetical protein
MARAPRGSSTFGVEVVGATGIRKALAPLLEPELTKALDRANKKGAQLYAKRLRPAVGARSKRMRKAVRVRRAKTGKPGWVIGSKRSVAFFWPFVIGGTRDHGPRKADALRFRVGSRWVTTKSVRGVKADPIVEKVGRSSESEVERVINQAFAEETGL